MHSGTIISLRLDKGYGFVFEKAGTPDIFFHMSDLADGLEFDERLKERRVKFDLVQNGDRFRAANVHVAE